MGLMDVLDAVEAQATNANDSRIPVGLKFYLGPYADPQHLECPSVVWIPDTSPIEGAEHGGYNPQQVFTQRQRVEIHIWGADPDKSDPVTQRRRDYAFTEAIKDAVLVALFDQLEGSVFPISSDSGDPDNLQYGMMFVVLIDVLLPVAREPDPTATPDNADVNGVIDPPQ